MSHPRTIALTILALAQVAGAAWGQAKPETFPSSLERDVLTAWLSKETTLRPADVVSVKATDLIGIVSLKPLPKGAPTQFQLSIRAEVLSPEIVAEAHRSSWSAEVDVDCATIQAKVRKILDYPSRNLKGTPREANTSGQWIAPAPGAHLYNLISAVCYDGYRRPLVTDQKIAGGKSPAVPPRATVIEPSPPATTAAVTAPSAAPLTSPTTRPPPPSELIRVPSETSAASVKTAVQVTASSSRAHVETYLKAMREQFPMDGLSTSTVAVKASGKTLYRGLISGFASDTEANTFCRSVQASGKDCLLRGSGGRTRR